MVEQAIEAFEAQDVQREMDNRRRAAVRQGMMQLLNVGFAEGTPLYVPQHQMRVEMPEPGATFDVPRSVAAYLLRMYGKKIQSVAAGQLPANFTPPPGYVLVKADTVATIPGPDEEALLVEPETEVNEEE